MAAPVISSPASDTRNVAMTCAIVSAATADRRNPQPSSTAMMARSRNPLSFVLSGVFSSACACFWDSQFHTKPVDFESLVRGLETFLETRNRRALPFHGKWICAPGESDSAGEGLDPRIPGREVEGLANGSFRGVFPRRSRVQFAVGQ